MNNGSKKVWPPLLPKAFEVEKPVCEYIKDWAEYRPDRLALRFYGRDINYGELDDSINRFAQGLLKAGLKKGDRVAVFMQNCPQFIISFLGTLRAGGVVVCLNPMFKQAELEYEINDAGAEILVALDYLYPEVEKINSRLFVKLVILTSLQDYIPAQPVLPLPPEAQRNVPSSFEGVMDFMQFLENSSDTHICNINNMEEDLALLQYTGGTTGLPKGSMLTHYNLAYSGVGTVYWFRSRYDDVSLGVTPFFHIMGMVQLMCTSLISGGQLVVLSRFDSGVTARAIELYGCTFWVTATTSLIALLETPEIDRYNFDSLRCLWSGGTPISVEIQKRISQLAPNAMIGEGYGLTECVSQGGTSTPLLRYKPGFTGVPQLNEMKIVDRQTGQNELPPGEEGEIIIKGPTVMKGYWNKPKETRETVKEGWLFTGDIGLMDEEGYLKIIGRKKELIKCSGYSVFPSEVENLLFKNPKIAETAVIGVEDPYRGESPKAFIVLKSEHEGKVTEKEILDWCKENMATYKRPRIIEFRRELPKSAAGKLLRRVLLEENPAL
ncbi:MAG: AMP-binding protein [Desulfobacteraceae bacterium]|nr:AMP-binding protein [Desulfobacteraceae bacterium]